MEQILIINLDDEDENIYSTSLNDEYRHIETEDSIPIERLKEIILSEIEDFLKDEENESL